MLCMETNTVALNNGNNNIGKSVVQQIAIHFIDWKYYELPRKQQQKHSNTLFVL